MVYANKSLTVITYNQDTLKKCQFLNSNHFKKYQLDVL